jgi:hypothetical protein
MKCIMIDRGRFLRAAAKLIALSGIVSGMPQAAAHISYSGRNFGAFNADGNDPVTFITSNSVQSDFGWASGIDASLGDSHKLLPYRFTLLDPGFVTIRVEGSSYSYTTKLPPPISKVVTNLVAGLPWPAFTLCSGLAHPSSTDHDQSPSSLTYLDIVYPETLTDGCFDALGNWCIGRDSATDLSDLTRFRYVGNAYDGSATNLAQFVNQLGAAMDDFGAVYRFTNDAIHGDGAQDGAVTATYFLTPGDYSLFVGGGNYYGLGNAGGRTKSFGVKVTIAADPPMQAPSIAGYKVGWGLSSGLTDSSWSDTNTVTPPQWTQIATRDSSATGTDAEGTVYWNNASPGGMRWLSSPAVKTSVGNGFLAALETTGTIAVQAGNSPEVTIVSDPLHPFLSFEAARDFIVALKYDETVAVWSGGGIAPTNIPADLTNAIAVAAGAGHVIALRRDGTITAWGAGNGGQLIVPTDLSGVVQVTAGDGFSAALRADGSVSAWGALTMTIPSGTNPVVQIAAGSAHLAALFSDGTVQCWGDNSAGQCTPPKGLGRAFRIACGGRSTMVLTSERRTPEDDANPSPTPNPSPTNVTADGSRDSNGAKSPLATGVSANETASSSSNSFSPSLAQAPQNSGSSFSIPILQTPASFEISQPLHQQIALSGLTARPAIPARQVLPQEEDARPSYAGGQPNSSHPEESKPYGHIPRYSSITDPEASVNAASSKVLPRPVDPKKKARTLYKLTFSKTESDGSPLSKGVFPDIAASGSSKDSLNVDSGSKVPRNPTLKSNPQDHRILSGFKTFVLTLWRAMRDGLSKFIGTA